jgi:hypothetical protein
MSDKLKKFVDDHRQEFDTKEPGQDLWEKIDARLEIKTPAGISSSWLLKFKYLAFSASVLVLAIYLITQNINHSTASELSLKKFNSASIGKGPHLNSDQVATDKNASEKMPVKVNDDLSGGSKSDKAIPASGKVGQQTPSNGATLPAGKKDSLTQSVSFESSTANEENKQSDVSSPPRPGEPEKPALNSESGNKENTPPRSGKKPEIYIPEEPATMNNYTGTLYDCSYICSVLRAYKFPGKVFVDKGRSVRHSDVRRMALTTTSCSHFERRPEMKVVWLKGRTDKEITLSIKKGFKNIVLMKSNGMASNPEAISHYYPGLGIISEHKGKYFDIVFKDKVELILVFKDAGEGDKIVIDGTIEAVVKNKP